MKRTEGRKALKGVYEAMHAARRDDVKQERLVKSENAAMVKSLKQYEIQRAVKARTEIRAHQQRVSERFTQQREAHQEFLAQDFINMIAMEDRRREQVEAEIAEMEQEERTHIEQLRALQEEQKQAYDALEQALSSH